MPPLPMSPTQPPAPSPAPSPTLGRSVEPGGRPQTGPVVLVTGASSGIGRACAVAFARTHGHGPGPLQLVLVARRGDELERTGELARAAAPLGGVTVTCHAADLVDGPAIAELVDRMQLEHGRLDVLVNNAGIGVDTPYELGAGGDVATMLDLNLRVPVQLTAACYDLLRSARGAVVNVSSVASLVGTPKSPAYSATKWGLTGFSEALRARWTTDGIRVACVLPGPVPTPGWPHERMRRHPLRRALVSDVRTVAEAVVAAARPGGRPTAVVPRTYAVLPVLRVLAPGLLRWLLRIAASRTRDAAGGSTAPTAGRTR